MANRFSSPNQQFTNSAGVPYVGGKLYFYVSGTSTPLATYSDSALTVANTNPVTLDAAGRAGDIFLQNLGYKVVLTDSLLNTIWTADPVYSSDYSTVAAFQTHAGSPNGAVAGTAGSGSVPSSVIWDSTGNILYVCTQTGSAAVAVWTAVNAAAAAAVIPVPQGYLTPTTGTPIISGDVVSATAIYYTPYVGNLIPIYNGAAFVPTTFSELTLTLSASQALNTLYDVFVFNYNGILTLVTGPAWSVSTAGAGARGTGAGTTQLSRVNGIWTNAVQMSAKNGATTYTVNANLGTYVGTLYIDGVAGQVTCHRTFGQSRKWGIWNAYNRVPISVQAGDSTASWSYDTTTVRASNNNSANSISVLCGLPEEQTTVSFGQRVRPNSGTTNTLMSCGIGWNLTTAFAAQAELGTYVIAGPNATSVEGRIRAFYIAQPAIGVNVAYACEYNAPGAGSTGSNIYYGTQTYMNLIANWRG